MFAATSAVWPSPSLPCNKKRSKRTTPIPPPPSLQLKGLGPGVPEGPGRIESSVEAYLGRAHEALMLGCIRAAEEEATEK